MRSLSFQIEPAANFAVRRTVVKSSAFRNKIFGKIDREVLASEAATIEPSMTTACERNYRDIVEPTQRDVSTLPAPWQKSLRENRASLRLAPKSPNVEIAAQPVHERSAVESLQGNRASPPAYKGHAISTRQLPDGSWVATFKRVDGAPIVVCGIGQFVVTSAAYLTNLLAVADAEVEIDAIAAYGC